jgi:Short C-terminal domain
MMVIRNTGFLAALLALIFMGCAGHGKLSSQDKQDGKTFWSHRYQYVRLIPQEHCTEVPVAANSHPQDLSGRLQAALASMRIDLPDQEKTAPVFTHSELVEIIGPLLRAFKKAAPDEDVALAVEGMHPGQFGLQRSILTARLFIRNGNTLEVIFGKKLFTPVEDYDPYWHAEPKDYRLSPLVPGSRCQKADKKFPAILTTPTVRFHEQEGTARQNWLAISLVASAKPAQASMPMAMPMQPPATQTPALNTPPAAHGTEEVIPKATAEPHPRSIEEKLQTLKNLRDKGLITEQEYLDKKKEILDSL